MSRLLDYIKAAKYNIDFVDRNMKSVVEGNVGDRRCRAITFFVTIENQFMQHSSVNLVKIWSKGITRFFYEINQYFYSDDNIVKKKREAYGFNIYYNTNI